MATPSDDPLGMVNIDNGPRAFTEAAERLGDIEGPNLGTVDVVLLDGSVITALSAKVVFSAEGLGIVDVDNVNWLVPASGYIAIRDRKPAAAPEPPAHHGPS